MPPGRRRKTAGSNAPGAFLVFYPAVRTGSSNTHFFSVVFFFFGGHLPQTSGFCSAKEILAVSFATQTRAFILSDRNIFYTPGGWRGEQRRGLMPLGLFLFFLGGHLPQTSGFRSAKQILVVSFAIQARAFILSDRNIFNTPRGGGRTTAGSNAPGAFLVLFYPAWLPAVVAQVSSPDHI